MPLSISSFNERIPKLNYALQWTMVAVMFFALFIGYESFWRSRGFEPTVNDDMGLWCYWRGKVYEKFGKSLVVLGASQILGGISYDVLKQKFPTYNIVMLAIDAKDPFLVLKDLANDQQFSGLVLYETIETQLFFNVAEKKGSAAWVQSYHQDWTGLSRIGKTVELRLRVFFQSIFVTFHSSLNPVSLWFNGAGNPYLMRDFNRFAQYHYYEKMTPAELEDHKQKRIERTENFSNWYRSGTRQPLSEKELKAKMQSVLNQLKERGGDVVFLKMPTTGNYLELTEVYFPKKDYWDKVSGVLGVKTIHFMDYPELSGFDCPDTFHLDAGDAEKFTSGLSGILKNSGLR